MNDWKGGFTQQLGQTHGEQTQPTHQHGGAEVAGAGRGGGAGGGVGAGGVVCA